MVILGQKTNATEVTELNKCNLHFTIYSLPNNKLPQKQIRFQNSQIAIFLLQI
jgi:hypothetical protein